MNVLAIGYFDDFARFFLAIKKELRRENKNIHFEYLSIYLSGYLYFIARFHSVSFFSFSAWVNMLWNKKTYRQYADLSEYKGINLDTVIRYHKKLGCTNEEALKLQAISYITLVERMLIKFNPDVIVLSGDSRMLIEIIDIKAKARKIKTFYFEQGPFGTTILDDFGVNANASLRNTVIQKNDIPLNEMQKQIDKFFKRIKPSKYTRNPIYRGSDYIFQVAFNKLGLLPIDIAMSKLNNNIYENYSKFKYSNNSNNSNNFLLILQVPDDVNMVFHSPYYSNHYSIVKDVYENLPNDSKLEVREHPLFTGRYESKMYKFLEKNGINLNKVPLQKAIDNSNVIVVNNSTVGIEAIARFKPVIVLGNSYYDNDYICLKLKQKKDLSMLLNNSLSYQVNNSMVIIFLYYFLYTYLIDGHFRDNKISAAKVISKKILKYA